MHLKLRVNMLLRIWFPLCLLACFPGALWACPDIDGLLDINCDQKLKIVAFGDSITFGRSDSRGIGYPGRIAELFPNAIVVNAGDPGENTWTGRSRSPFVFSDHSDADFVIVLEGVNDYNREDRSAFTTRSNLLDIVADAEDTGAITLLGQLTDIRRDFQRPWVIAVNDVIEAYTQIDFFSLGRGIISSDLIHPNAAGYDEMAELVREVLIEVTDDERPKDSDLDGIYDFAEVQFGSSKNNPDSDDDGLLDGDEVFTHGSSPVLVDTDADGLSDPIEVSNGGNPADPRPSPPMISQIEAIL